MGRPKPKPSAWDAWCDGWCGERTEHGFDVATGGLWCLASDCHASDESCGPTLAALWGHEWAAVAFMALAQKTLNEAHLCGEAWVVGAIWDHDLPYLKVSRCQSSQ